MKSIRVSNLMSGSRSMVDAALTSLKVEQPNTKFFVLK